MTDLLNALVLLANFVIVPSIAYGAQLALGALGVTLIYAVLRFANFAHGELMSFGAMATILATWWLQSMGVSIDPLPTMLLALPFGIVAAAALTLFFDKTVFSFYRTQRAVPVTFTIVSVGMMFIINGLIRFIIGPNNQQFADGSRFLFTARDFKEWTGLEEGLAIRTSQAITLAVALVVVAAVFWFLQKSRTGKSMRAYSDNEDLALLSGIDPARVVMVAWVMTAGLATIAGALYGLDKVYKPFVYLQLLLPVFASAVVGGIGQPIGAIAGGFVVAFSEVTVTYAYKKFISYLVPEAWEPDSLVQLLGTEYKFAVSFVILVLVLLIRPTGIFRGRLI